MRGKRAGAVLLFWLLLLAAGTLRVHASDTGAGGTLDQAKEYLMDQLEFREINEALQEMFPGERWDFGEMTGRILTGDLTLSWELVRDMAREKILYALEVNKESLAHMLLIAVAASVFSNFADVLRSRQISELSFYLLYMLVIALGLYAFQSASAWVEEGIAALSGFMKILSPVYFAAVAAAKGSVTAAAFYNLVLILIFLVQLLILKVLLPVTNLYMMVRVLDFLSQEEYLSRFTDLIETLINWTLKTLTACVTGLGAIQGLIAPAIDSVKRSALTRGVEAIPGVGDAIGGTAEVIIGAAVVVKNSVGIAGMLICVALFAAPLIQTGLMVLMYKVAAAVIQPVSDRRMTGCIGSMADGCQLLMRMILTAGLLFLITIAIVAATTSSV